MRRFAVLLSVALLLGCSKAEPPASEAPEPGAGGREGAAQKPAKVQPAAEQAKTAKPAKKEEPAAIDVPMVYLETVLGSLSKAERMKLMTMQQAAQQFKALEGRYPRDIEDFKRAGFTPQPLGKDSKWKFDPKTGKVSILKLQPKR